jgi:hypothetical protein
VGITKRNVGRRERDNEEDGIGGPANKEECWVGGRVPKREFDG